jgi:predicted ribosome quality control (RQC) complex YloA/Tae2 family protein
MQTALHILSLTIEIKRELLGGTIANTEFYKKERSGYLFVKSKTGLWAIATIFHPAGPGYYLVPGSKVKIETREKPWPIFDLTGATVVAVEQPVLDRAYHLIVEKNGKRQILVVQAIGPNGNLWLLDDQYGKLATLRNREFTPGDKYEMPIMPERLDPKMLNADSLAEAISKLIEDSPDLPLAIYLEKSLIGFNKTLARETAFRAGLADFDLEEIEPAHVAKLATVIGDIVTRFSEPESGYIYTIAGGTEVYPFKLSSIDEQPEKVKSLSMAIMTGASRKQDKTEERDERKATLDLVSGAIRKLERRIKKVEADILEAQDFEHYKRLGELLQINFDKLKRGLTSIELEDVIAGESQQLTIKLEQALSPQENIEGYFRRYRKGREGLDLLQRRLEITRGELGELQEIAENLDRQFEQAIERYRPELDSLRPRAAGPSSAPAQRLPYKPYHLSTGLTIFVGRDGSDNDRTTFDFAKPYELWFHTQQCPGSHVVIKFPNKSFEPSKAEIEETAAIAAFFSKAKNDSLVPVIYTERRYVRKPAKAKPGLVMVEREKSVMVAPKKPAEAHGLGKD